MSKRYVLLVSTDELSEEDRKDLSSILEDRYGKVSVITVRRNPRALIVKTTNSAAPLLRKTSGELRLGEKRLAAVLTSGSIGKLKSIAAGSETIRDVKVPK
jgi:hypothetical protein